MAYIMPYQWTTPAGEVRTGRRVYYRDANGKRRNKLFSGPNAKREAAIFRSQIEIDLEKGIDLGAAEVDDLKITVAQAGHRWIKGKEGERRERTTTEGYQVHVDQHLSPLMIPVGRKEFALGAIRVVDLTPKLCLAVKDRLLASQSTENARKILGSFRMLLNDSCLRGPIKVNPAIAVHIRDQHRDEPKDIEIPTKEEIARLLAHVHSAEPQAPTMVEVYVKLVMFSGVRPSEARGLAFEDIDFDGRDSRSGGKPGLTVGRRSDKYQQIGAPKTANAHRFIPLPPKIIALLRRWQLRIRAIPAFAAPGVVRPIKLIFPNKKGKPQSHANIINRMWNPTLAEVGLAEQKPTKPRKDRPAPAEPPMRWQAIYSPNMLRDLYASIQIAPPIRMNAKQLSVLMGHHSPTVTLNHYAKLFEAAEATADAALAMQDAYLK